MSIPRVPAYADDSDPTAPPGQTGGLYSSLVQLQREENYADQSKAKELVIKVYGYDNEAFRELMMCKYVDGDSWHESDKVFVRQSEIKKSKGGEREFFQDNEIVELKLQLTLRFAEYRDMIECYQHLEAIVENGQSQHYQVQRQMFDYVFWNSKLPVYTHLLTSQYMFWHFNSITEE